MQVVPQSVINDSISFDYPASVGLFESITDSSLHIPLHKPSASSTPMEPVEGAVLVSPPSKKGQLPSVEPNHGDPWPQIQVQTQTLHNSSITRDQRAIL